MASELLGMIDHYRRTDDEMRVEQCPNCNGPTKLRRNDRRVVWPLITENLAPPLTPYATEEVWTCVVCDQSLVRLLVFGRGDVQERDPDEIRILYPDRAPRSLPAEAPDSVASLYREASIAENAGALRGSAGLYRAAVEELVKDQGSTSGTLMEKIEALKAVGVEADIVTDLHEARLLGNWSLHDGVEFAADEVSDVAQLVADAVHQLYVEPAQREAMRRARSARRSTRGSQGSP